MGESAAEWGGGVEWKSGRDAQDREARRQEIITKQWRTACPVLLMTPKEHPCVYRRSARRPDEFIKTQGRGAC